MADLSPDNQRFPEPAPTGYAVPFAGAFYCTGEENLRITSFGSLAGAVLTLRSRFLRANGEVVVSADAHTPNSDRSIKQTETPLAEGWMSGCEVFASSGSPRRGQIFVIVEVIRGSGAGAFVLSTLVQGYVTDTSRLAYPGSAVEAMASGYGVIRSITGTNPAANTEVQETVPTNARWILRAFTTTLVADANVANRETSLTFDDGVNVYARVATGTAQTAGQTRDITFARDVQRGAPAAGNTLNAPLPNIVLMGGHRINTATFNRQVGDDYGAPQYLVEEFIED